MTSADLTIPKRWIEGHLSDLEAREAGAEHAIRAALSPADRFVHTEELEQIRATKRSWLEVLIRIATPARHHREHR